MVAIQCSLGESFGLVAPFYNLVLVIIVVIFFIRLFKVADKKVYLLPWKFLFFAILIYVVEELLTVFVKLNLISISPILNPLFEFVIITSFIYMLLLQKKFIGKRK